MISKRQRKSFLTTMFAVLFCLFFSIIMNGEAKAQNIILQPAKIELIMEAGEKDVANLLIVNQLGRDASFKVEVRDFIGSMIAEKPTLILESEESPYSLKNYLKPQITGFTLKSGQQLVLPIEVALPENASPGGLYATVDRKSVV